MDAASTNASPASKVIVQCTDPHNLFDLVTPLLQSRLPLSNLHWKSATRPLRSIDSLDVSLVREESDPSKTATRHQIPGLRQAPYLKVYLVRCDDKERYKESVRKELKDWVKSLAISRSGKSTIKGQERHDAYEYLIVHVVLPGTPAATQPKSSKHISLEASESTESVNSTTKSKWIGKSSSTIFDKLRADFHSSSKAPFERVAQVRISDATKPSAVLSPLELEEQWQDLVDRLKAAILQSFDARVSQYEDDIREREAQRSLPGWNFCTFFILKEGLARAFENVGLLEDAMKVYEELDAGLDVVIQDQARDNYTDATNALLPYATDLKDTIRKVLENDSPTEKDGLENIDISLQAWAAADSKQFPWRLERRDYQQMILTNQVSALDFRIYIFIRQMQILLRRANVHLLSPKSKPSHRSSVQRWDADVLSSVCERSIRFLGLAARNLRQDLFAAWGGQEGLSDGERQVQKTVIDNIVASWKWSSLLQTLSECQIITALSQFSEEHDHRERRLGELFDAKEISESWNGRDRSHSIVTHTSSDNGSLANGLGQISQKNMFSAIRIVQGSKEAFVFQAAELFLMLRGTVAQVGKEKNLLSFLRSQASNGSSSDKDLSAGSRGILATSLNFILNSEQRTNAAYKLLTLCACQCYLTAGKGRAPRQLCFELANLELSTGNDDAAMAWLDSVADSVDVLNYSPMDLSILETRISCLERSRRFEELTRSLLLLLQLMPQSQNNTEKSQAIWNRMMDSAKSCGGLEIPLVSIFSVESVDAHIIHVLDAGGFGIQILLRTILPIKDFGSGEIIVRMQSQGQNMPEDISMRYIGRLNFQGNSQKFLITTSVTTEGWYEVVSLAINVGSVRFQHQFKPDAIKLDANEEPPPPEHSAFNHVYVYSSPKAPHITITDNPFRDLSLRRSALINIDLRSLPQSLTRARLRLKPATAGLRLDLRSLADRALAEFEVVQTDEAHILEILSLEAPEVRLEIPYILENQAILSITIRAELNYAIAEDDFALFETLSTSCILPISVNVQDNFQASATFSQFTFAPSRPIPIRIDDCSLKACGKYRVISTCPRPTSINAFAKQPVSWTAKIENSGPNIDSESVQENDAHQLELAISYKCVDEAILQTVRKKFTTSIIETPFVYAMRPLLVHLLAKIQHIWTEYEIEAALLLDEVEMWTFEELDWIALLHAFDRTVRADLELWLRQWHEMHRVIQLQSETAPQRMLKLLLDTPRPLLTLTTSIKPKRYTTHAEIGQPMSMELRISSRRLSQTITSTIEASVEFISQNDLWLVGGARKITFDLCDEAFICGFVLVPQKAGSLILPSIDVKCRRKDDNAALAAEVEHQDCATTIEVCENVCSTILGIGDGENSDGYWFIDGQTAIEA